MSKLNNQKFLNSKAGKSWNEFKKDGSIEHGQSFVNEMNKYEEEYKSPVKQEVIEQETEM